jgi:predicted acetyltransferase
MALALVKPSRAELPGYIDALTRGWSPDNVRGEAASREQLAKIDVDADAFLAGLDDPEARGGPIVAPDGGTFERLPGIHRWLWDGEFCGSIGFRWAKGTAELPPHVLGHIGYAVTPWKQGRGYATAALRLLLPEARALGLPYVELTTDPDNVPSQRVILNNAGYLVERFTKPAVYGGSEGLRYRIEL